jgi:hypothetical protein
MFHGEQTQQRGRSERLKNGIYRPTNCDAHATCWSTLYNIYSPWNCIPSFFTALPDSLAEPLRRHGWCACACPRRSSCCGCGEGRRGGWSSLPGPWFWPSGAPPGAPPCSSATSTAPTGCTCTTKTKQDQSPETPSLNSTPPSCISMHIHIYYPHIQPQIWKWNYQTKACVLVSHLCIRHLMFPRGCVAAATWASACRKASIAGQQRW